MFSFGALRSDVQTAQAAGGKVVEKVEICVIYIF